MDPDEAVFTKLPNGDDLETGSMPSPDHGGAVTTFEEVWRAGPLASAQPGAWILQSVQDGGKTFLARVGGYYLALSEADGKPFTALREEWNEEKGSWEERFKSGDVDRLPSLVSLKGDVFQGTATRTVGETVTLDGLEFVVRGIEED